MQPRSPDPATAAPAQRRKTLAGVIGSVAAAAALFVLVPKEESGRTVTATVNADQSITVTHVAGKQYLQTYLDIAKVPTACDGITGPGVRMGMRFTPAQCATMLEQQLIAHAEPIIRCVPSLKGRTDQVIAAVSLSYNIGVAGVCGSSIAKSWNAGKWRAGCDRFPLFDKVTYRLPQKGLVCSKIRDGRYMCTVPGLSARRARERTICVKELPA